MSGFLSVLLGNVIRLGSGMFVFVLLARWLGPSAFGGFAYWLAIATMATVPINFGLNTFVLREFGARPDDRAQVMARVLSAKLLLAGIVIVGALLIGLPVLSAANWLIFGPLLLAQVAESFSEFYQLSYRAASAYRAEAANASLVAGLHLLLVVGAVSWVARSPEVAALAFGLSRVAGLFITRRRAQTVFVAIGLAPVTGALGVLRQAFAYASEFGLTTAYQQLDVLVIEAMAGLRAVGLYQAGMKLVQGVARLAPIMALYVLPRLTQRIAGGTPSSGSRQSALLTVLLFAGVGAGFGSVLALGASHIASGLFGKGYADLPDLLPWFGLLLMLRFTETGAGLVLVAAGLQSRKTWLVALQLAIMLGGGAWAIGVAGVKGWLICSLVATGLLLCTYLLLWSRRPITSPELPAA